MLREVESCVDPLGGPCNEDVIRAAMAVADAVLGVPASPKAP